LSESKSIHLHFFLGRLLLDLKLCVLIGWFLLHSYWSRATVVVVVVLSLAGIRRVLVLVWLILLLLKHLRYGELFEQLTEQQVNSLSLEIAARLFLGLLLYLFLFFSD
jgi:hypothetical protein